MTKFSKCLTRRELCDLELLMDGSFSPLTGFHTEKDFLSVAQNMRLENGKLWPIPIILTISAEEKAAIGLNDSIILTDQDGYQIAEMNIEDIYKPNMEDLTIALFGTNEDVHPYISILMQQNDNYCIGGSVTKISNIFHKDFSSIRYTPEDMKHIISTRKWDKVVAFQTRNPMHKSHFYLTLQALEEAGSSSHLLLHPVVGVTQPTDIYYQLRVRCYEKLMRYYPEGRVFLSVLPLSMRMAGPREALWHAIIRKNYGATHFIVGRDHAGPSYKKLDGNSFFNPYDAQQLVEKHAKEIGIIPIFSKEIVYIPETGQYLPIDTVPKGITTASISGTQQRQLLSEKKQLPEWFTFPEVSSLLMEEFDTCMSVNP